MKIKNIDFNIFDKMRWETPFFVFDKEIDTTLLNLHNQIWNSNLENFDFLNDEDDLDESDLMWSLDIENLSFDGHNDEVIGAYNKTFNIYKEQAIHSYAQKNNINFNRIFYVPMLDNLENKWNNTQNALNDDAIDLIVDPHFVLRTSNNDLPIKSTFFIWDKKANKIVYLKYSMSVNKEYYQKAFYDLSVLQNIGIKVEDISVYLMDLIDKYEKSSTRGQIKFREQRAGSFAKGKAAPGDGQLKKQASYLKNSGLFLEKAKEFGHYKNLTLFDLASANYMYTKNPIFQIKDDVVTIKYDSWDNEKNIINIYESFKYVINNILNLYLENPQLNSKSIYNFFFGKNINNFDDFENNDFDLSVWNERVKHLEQSIKLKLAQTLFGPHFRENSSKLYGAPDKQFLVKDTKNFDQEFINYPNFWRLSTLNVIKKIHVKNARTIWYDYEGLSSILPIINGNFSYQQIVNQVSIIETVNGEECHRENLVIDTNNMKLIDLVEFIEKIYSNGADNFVVFNKTYENSRNSEIEDMVKNAFERARNFLENNQNYYNTDAINEDVEFYKAFLAKGYDHWTKFSFLVQHINSNTIDLADCFKASSTLTSTPGYEHKIPFEIQDNKIVKSNVDLSTYKTSEKLLHKLSNNVFLKQLHYTHSIKKIEHVITSNQLKLKTLIKPYKSLKIQKGTMAMDEAIKRYVGITDDNVWNYISKKLKEYCENDVLAMIMVYEFIMQIVRTTNPEIDNYEYNLDSSDVVYTLEEQKIVVAK